MKIKDVISALECFAPLPLQEDYDNAGLQVGLTEAEVSGVLLCLDITEAVISEAEEKGCNMIVSHHPLLFRGLKQISDANQVQRTTMMAIQKGITIASMHTNLDSVKGGVNYMIARHLGLTDIRLVGSREVNGVEGGIGIVGTLPEPLTSEQYINKVKAEFKAGTVMTNEPLQRPIRTVAICGGAGSFFLSSAIREKADAFLTGEMHYHEYFGHEQEILISVIGHFESERYTKELLAEIIRNACPDVRIAIGQDTNPVRYW